MCGNERSLLIFWFFINETINDAWKWAVDALYFDSSSIRRVIDVWKWAIDALYFDSSSIRRVIGVWKWAVDALYFDSSFIRNNKWCVEMSDHCLYFDSSFIRRVLMCGNERLMLYILFGVKIEKIILKIWCGPGGPVWSGSFNSIKKEEAHGQNGTKI